MKVVFKQILTDEKHQKMMNEFQNNDNFSIDITNFPEFFDCNYVLDMLKDNSIDYKIILDDGWNPERKHDYSVYGKILISDIDYEKIKDLIEFVEEIPDSYLDKFTETDTPSDDPINTFNDSSSIIRTFLYIIIAIVIIILFINQMN